jgi:hypothetical protein
MEETHDILSQDVNSLRYNLNIHSNHDNNNNNIDEEEIGIFLLSLMTNKEKNNLILNELKYIFNLNNEDLLTLQLIIESSNNNNIISPFVIEEIKNLNNNNNNNNILIINNNNEFPKIINNNSIIVYINNNNNNENYYIIESKVNKINRIFLNSFRTNHLPFGFYQIKNNNFIISSPVYDFCVVVDDLYELLYWGWGSKNSNTFTNDIEVSLLELCVAVNEDLKNTIKKWQPMMVMMGGGLETKKMMECIETDILISLNQHQSYNMGRLHQTLTQLLETTETGLGILQIPNNVILLIKKFIRSKLNASSLLISILRKQIKKVVIATKIYIKNINPSSQEYTRLNKFIDIFDKTNNDNNELLFNDEEIYILEHSLRPKGFELISSSSSLSSLSQSNTIACLPVIPLSAINNNNNNELINLCRYYSECLSMECLNIGSMLGLSLSPQLQQYANNCILKLLNSGFSYVITTSCKIVALLPINRSILCLNSSSLPNLVIKRHKDVIRVLKNYHNDKNNQNEKIQLRLNSNFDLCILKLRQHHSDDCWVGNELEEIWRHMFNIQTLLIFELWIGSELVAADFSHPCGILIYFF